MGQACSTYTMWYHNKLKPIIITPKLFHVYCNQDKLLKLCATIVVPMVGPITSRLWMFNFIF